MLKKINWLVVAQMAVVLVIALAPHFAFAQLKGITCDPSTGLRCNETSLTQIIHTVINWALYAAGVVALIALIIGGFRFLTSGGNADAATKGRLTVIHAVIGLAIIILSYIIVQAVAGFVQGSSGVTGP